MSGNNYYPPPPGPPPTQGYVPSTQGYAAPPQPTYQQHQQPANSGYYNDPGPQQAPYNPPQAPYNAPQSSYNPPQSAGKGYSDPPPPYTTFEEKFAIPKPKYNDLWAAILFIVDMCGLIAVSVITLNAYRVTKSTNGNGIYDGRRNTFGLNTNTIILFAFVLGMAFVVSGIYLTICRKFTKKLIYITGILKYNT